MERNLIDIFEIEKTCDYRGEKYLVRDNGAVYRFRKLDKRKRPLDEKWTFGIPDSQDGYFNISAEAVHRIVATAFHGEQPSDKHVVDHFDTNRQNNRPENLRWVTRLENILLNPKTLSKILYLYGSIDNFFLDPSKPLYGVLSKNFEWMGVVTKEESDYTRNNLLNRAKEGKLSGEGKLSEWAYSNINQRKEEYKEQNLLVQSLSPNVIQKSWKIPSEFPNCPKSIDETSLIIYKERLTKGKVFSKNKYGESIVENSEINESTNELLVITSGGNIKPYILAKIYIVESNFIHESIRSFFTLNGAQKQFNLALGFEWEGEDSIDDYS